MCSYLSSSRPRQGKRLNILGSVPGLLVLAGPPVISIGGQLSSGLASSWRIGRGIDRGYKDSRVALKIPGVMDSIQVMDFAYIDSRLTEVCLGHYVMLRSGTLYVICFVLPCCISTVKVTLKVLCLV